MQFLVPNTTSARIKKERLVQDLKLSKKISENHLNIAIFDEDSWQNLRSI